MADKDHTTTQADKFRQIARELECDEDEEAFKAKLRHIARAVPAPLKVETPSE